MQVEVQARYRLLLAALARVRRSRHGRWLLVAGSGASLVVFGFLALRHFASTSWPLSEGQPGVLVAAGLLLLLAQVFKACGWGRLFTPDERPGPLALAAGNGGAAIIGVVLPGRFDDAMRVAVVRRYPGCPAGVRALCFSLIMLGLIDSVALAPLAGVAGAAGDREWSARRAGRRRDRRRRSRAPDPRSSSSFRQQAIARVPIRSLAELARDAVATSLRGLGARVCMLAGAGCGVLPPPRDARSRVLGSADPAVAVRRGSGGSIAHRPGRRGHAGRRRRGRPNRLGRRELASAGSDGGRRGARRPQRRRRLCRCCCLANRPDGREGSVRQLTRQRPHRSSESSSAGRDCGYG
jgi:hypothetical protein